MADTLKAALRVDTVRSVVAVVRACGAFVDVGADPTVALEPRFACAVIAAGAVGATGISRAFRDTRLTLVDVYADLSVTLEAWLTATLESAGGVDALRPSRTGVPLGCAFVYIGTRTVFARSVPVGAATLVASIRITTDFVLAAGGVRAFVYIDAIAVLIGDPAFVACAVEATFGVRASPIRTARVLVRRTLIFVRVTQVAFPAIRTGTGGRPICVSRASRLVEAGVRVAGILKSFRLTKLSLESRCTFTGRRSIASIETCPAVLARIRTARIFAYLDLTEVAPEPIGTAAKRCAICS